MHIDTILQAASLLNGLFSSTSSSNNQSTAFSTALSKAGTSAETSGTAGSASGTTSASAAATDRVLEKLNDYIQKGPVAALREKVLASMGLTEADLKALPPGKQEAVEAEIAQRIKEAMLEQQTQTVANATTTGAQASAANIWAAAANSVLSSTRTG